MPTPKSAARHVVDHQNEENRGKEIHQKREEELNPSLRRIWSQEATQVKLLSLNEPDPSALLDVA